MAKAGAILMASAEGPKLQKIIKANDLEQSMIVDLLPDTSQLFEQLFQQPYALLIIDLSLLVGLPNTPAPLAKINSVSPNTATLLLAADHERNQAIRQLQQGAADYILFPIDATELSLKVSHILGIQKPKLSNPQSVQLESATDDLLMLHKASQELSQTLRLDDALQIILLKAGSLTQASLTKIYLTDRSGNLDKNRAYPKASSLAGQIEAENLLFGLAEQAGETQELVHLHRTTSPVLQDQAFQSVLINPLISRGRLTGVLVLANEHASAFSSNQIRWLSVFSDFAAVTIENARLFEDLSSVYINLAQNREQIVSNRNTLQALFNGITDGLYILDQDLTINAVNQVEAESQGYLPAELVGKSYLSLDWTDAAPELLDQIQEVFQVGRKTTWISAENETEPYLKDREFRIYPVHNRLGQIEHVIVFAQDVSERRRWQASLFRSANLAAVGQLAGSVAHQINNPLTVTITNSQLLLPEVDPNSEAYELVTGIFKAGERIQKIISNLLEFSNQETYFFTRTDLIDTIEDALALVIRPLKKARIEVVKDYQVYPTLSTSVSHLKLVWMNLLLNARDAVVDHADQPQIIISTRLLSDREVAVTITDNGCGISEKDFDQLFRPFFTTKPVGQALGLGLYSAHTIIERHNGQIKVRSQPEVETTFEVILPLDNPRDL